MKQFVVRQQRSVARLKTWNVLVGRRKAVVYSSREVRASEALGRCRIADSRHVMLISHLLRCPALQLVVVPVNEENKRDEQPLERVADDAGSDNPLVQLALRTFGGPQNYEGGVGAGDDDRDCQQSRKLDPGFLQLYLRGVFGGEMIDSQKAEERSQHDHAEEAAQHYHEREQDQAVVRFYASSSNVSCRSRHY